jgi:hypothetical protein
MTRVFFIVSSGRSGTAMLAKALGSAQGVTMEHEYMVHLVQPLAVRRYQGLVDSKTAVDVLASTHGAAAIYAQTPLWGDSSNKLSWLIPELSALFPEARFIHLVRDGRKVTSSYFHKLADECYDERSTEVLAAHLADPSHVPPPPPEKKYWWPQPKRGERCFDEFPGYDQFERICWHWSEVNRVILKDLAAVPDERKLFLRLEDLRDDPLGVRELFNFLGLRYRDEHFTLFARPHNVNRPLDTMLTSEQRASFRNLAGDMMQRLGYAGRAEYAVNY